MLHFYHTHVAESISQLSDSTLWLDVIMQQSQHHAVIRNALVIMSSLYKEYSQGSLGTSPYQLELINKAHKQLRLHLASRSASVDAALICSLIFYILECLIGNTEHAIWHLDRGLTLLQHYRGESMSLDLVPGFDRLVTVLSRLDVHASIFDNERRPILRLSQPVNTAMTYGVLYVAPNSPAPADLDTFERELTMLQNAVMHHLISYAEHKQTQFDQTPLWIIEQALYLQQEMQKLESNLEQILPSLENPRQNQHQRKILLRVEVSVFHGALLETIDASIGETKRSTAANRRFDIALADIRTLLPSSTTSPSSQIREFTLSTNLIAVLYYICMKSSDREIVQYALSIMQDSLSSTRDGLWDASMAVGVVQSLLPDMSVVSQSDDIKLEDLGSGIVDTSGGLEEAFRQLTFKSSGPGFSGHET
ncbi:unnamed protein product [Penicillium olsonii]|nr:unnamed protein product [Penicillium olsonii]